MRSLQSGLVDIIRDFLAVHARATDLVQRHAEGDLHFEDVRAWVGEDARSALFRLKERCHSIFRPSADDETPDMRVGALLDLAVGSLFHEAMKLRENLYQQERYGPRVQALRGESDPESLELFREFEKILAQSAQSLDESVAEVATLLDQTSKQLRRLMIATGGTGLAARCLVENEASAVAVDTEGLDRLFEQVYGDPVAGYVSAAESYLESAYYAEALEVFAEAGRRAPTRRDVQGASAFAEGMLAFFSRDHARSVARLAEWLDSDEGVDDPRRIQQALAGMQHIERLPKGDETPEVVARAGELSKRLRELKGRSEVRPAAS